MKKNRPYVLSIAGFDPSGGAGVLADIKTMEHFKCVGLGVVSAITFQNEYTFTGCNWLPMADIENQINILFKKYKIDVVKIGLIENMDVLLKTISFLKKKNKKIKIIWDPICVSSSGFNFHADFEKGKLVKILKAIFLITPNLDELEILLPTHELIAATNFIYPITNLYLKGGHGSGKLSKDFLFTKSTTTKLAAKRINGYDKHGTGCILSSAIASGLVNGDDLFTACNNAKKYVMKVMKSNKTKLGYHHI